MAVPCKTNYEAIIPTNGLLVVLLIIMIMPLSTYMTDSNSKAKWSCSRPDYRAVLSYNCIENGDTSPKTRLWAHTRDQNASDTTPSADAAGRPTLLNWKYRELYSVSSPHGWNFNETHILLETFPIDEETLNFVRQVKKSIFSVVLPTPFSTRVELAAYSEDVLSEILNMDNHITKSDRFLQFASGNSILHGSVPLAHRYGGHQFGVWADQLGDGRAHILGDYTNFHEERWELQLKGSGKTPYSRDGDGRAVVRSSVREYLCSEAMHYLGIPTSRAATLVVSEDEVWRDQFYNGKVRKEKTAVVLRLAKSWFRIGSFEILSDHGEIDELKQLADFVIEQCFPEIDLSDHNMYLAFFDSAVESTATLMALWMSVGFAHGVCNTDNFSILSITIDYGPFRFMDEYDPKMVPNTSDDEGRYSYENQPDVARFNLEKLKLSLEPLLTYDQIRQLGLILAGYNDIYKKKFMELFRRKLGLFGVDANDEMLVAILLKIMEETKADFTMTFRELGDWSLEKMQNNRLDNRLWAIQHISQHKWFWDWVKMFAQRLSTQDATDTERQKLMMQSNPRYVLRNWMAQNAIVAAEKGDYSVLNKLAEILKRPFEEQEAAELLGYADPPPDWAQDIKVSCSS